MIKQIANSIARKIIADKKNGKFILDVTDEAFSIFDLWKNFNFILTKYVVLYVIFWLLLLVILPAIIFHFFTFGWSVGTFLIGVIVGITFTIKIVKNVPIMVYQIVNNKYNKLKNSYEQN